MSDKIDVTWHLRADVNAAGFTLSGSGNANLLNGATSLELRLDPKLPSGFDPAVSQFICNFALAGYAAVSDASIALRDAVDRQLFVRPAREVKISDASGELLVRLEAVTTLTVTQTGISVTNYMTGFSALPAPVLQAVGEETLLPVRPGAATGIAHFRVHLENGAELDGLTVVPYRFDRQDVAVTPAIRSIRDQSCVWTSATELTLNATSEWKAMSVPVDGHCP